MNRRDFFHRAAAASLAGAVASAGTAVEQSPVAKSKIRVGMIGAEHSHAPGKIGSLLQLNDDFDLVGVAESDATVRQRIDKNPKFGEVRWLSEAELLRSSGLQAVVVETSVPKLLPAASRCVDAGLHVHLEKPAGTNHSDFKDLLEAAKRRKVHVQMGYMLRYNPAFKFCFEAVRNGWLGPIFEVSGNMSKVADDRGRRELLGYPGGAMLELGCHLIDALVFMLGPPERVAPFDRRSRTQQDLLVDNQLAVLEYPTATATIRCSLVDPEHNRQRHFHISGEHGAIEIRPLEPPRLRLILKRKAGRFETGQHEIEIPTTAGRFTEQLADFAAVTRGERPPLFTAEHDLAVHKAVLRASNVPVV
jgi:predicted dehydrogenase